jgi:hypothetical protein
MKLKVIFIQRIEGYEEEYMPEAVEVMDEYGYDENSQWLHEKLEKLRKESYVERAEIIDIEVPLDDILKILRPNKPVIKGKVV